MKKNLSSSTFFEEITLRRNFFPYLIVERKSKSNENRVKSVEKEKSYINFPKIGIELLLCERTSTPRTDTFSNSCFSIENVLKGLEKRYCSGNFIKISRIKLESKGSKNEIINEKNKKDRKEHKEHSFGKDHFMLESQNTTHYLVKPTKKMKKRNSSENRELCENRAPRSSLFRFISCGNDGILARTHAISSLAFSLSSLAEAVAGENHVCVCMCVCICVCVCVCVCACVSVCMSVCMCFIDYCNDLFSVTF